MPDMRIAIQVEADGAIKKTKEFNEELGKTPKAAATAGGSVDSAKQAFMAFSSAAGSAGPALAVAAAAVGAFVGVTTATAAAVAKAAGMTLNYSDSIVTMAQRTGLTTDALQAFNAMAKTGGSDLQALTNAAVKMEVGLAKGDEVFKKLGLSVTQLRAAAPDQAFAQVASAVAGIQNPMEKAAAAVAIFGKSGAEMLPLFTTEIEKARSRALDLGLVLDKDLLSASEALGDSMDEMGMAWDAFLMRIGGVITQSPAVKAAIEGVSQTFAEMSGWVDKNKAALLAYVNGAVDVAADAIVFLTGSLRGLLVMLQAASGPAGWMDLGGAFAKVDSIMASMNTRAKTFRETIRNAVTDMGGLGVLLPGAKLPAQSGGGAGTFNAGAARVEIKVQELKIPNLPNLWMDLFGAGSQGRMGTLQGGTKTYDLWSDPSKFLPPDLGGNTHVSGPAKVIEKPALDLAQVLQNLANVAALSSNKFAKAIASIAGGASGIAGGLGSLFGIGGKKADFGTGITALLGKAGVFGQIAASAIGAVSSIFGLFKKKPKEPAPEPPKMATAEAWAAHVSGQQDKGAAGILAGVSGILPTSPEAMADQAGIALSAYWAMWRERGPMAAAAAFAPIRDKMLETFKAGGASQADIDAMLGGLSTQIDLAQNQAFGGAAEGMNGYAQALASIANQQMPMTLEQFQAFERQAMAGYEQMKQAALDQGLTMEEAIRNALMASGQYLTTLRDAAARYGFDLGDGTQAMLDEAQRTGVSFGMDSQERLIMSLDALTTALGGAPPRFEQAMTNAARGGAGSGNSNADVVAAVDRQTQALDRYTRSTSDRPIQVVATIDGGPLIDSIAVAVDRGYATHLQTALSEGA